MALKIGDVDVVATAKATFKEFNEDDLQGRAAETAYHFLFSVVPLLIFLTALAGFVAAAFGVDNVMDDVTDFLFNRSGLPTAAAATLRGPIESIVANQAGGLLSFGAVLALWGAKNAISALMKALNVAFDVEDDRPFWKKTLVAVGLTLLLGLGIIAASLLFLAGDFLGRTLAELLGLGAAWEWIWTLLRIVLIPALLVLALAFLYWAGPNVDAPFKWLTPGSVLAVLLWVAATFGLQFYFRFAGGYVTAYGVLGAVMAFVFWLYVMNLILLLGGELNAVLARAHSPKVQAQVADNQARHGKEVDPVGRAGEEAVGLPEGSTKRAPAPARSPAPAPAPAASAAAPASPKQLLATLGVAAVAAAVGGWLRRLGR